MPHKGKQGTKGQKQIVEENKETLKFYSIMAGVAEILYIAVMILLFWDSFTILYWFLTLFTIGVFFGSLQFMTYMARPVYSDTGSIIDGGIDLNMEGGISEHLEEHFIYYG
ncbi:transmembrane protein 208-like isoform X2 [Centruroides sculpturatus]|uniref:transmembrane protein 208-like isoform X2 n=1 Tax=Centruroides sculpturatus TaxID=218467 RepID=UPI000C6D1B60|nr:transmembrane protein 208-like isoform X2 [Centruroides sculpturatus]